MSTSKTPPPASLVSPFKPGIFANRTVLITGGGTGIGRVMAQEFGQLGARIALCGRRPEPLAETATMLAGLGIQVHQGVCDIRDVDAVNAFVDGVATWGNGIDVLINNAGGQFPAPAAGMKPKGFDAVIRNNLSGTFNMTQAVANRAMIPTKHGRIINIIANILRGFPGMAHTGAARAGVENLTKSLAVEWAPYNIQVTAVAPGTILTSGTDQYDPQLMTRAREQTPAKRLGAPEEVAHLVCFLASDAADYITGTTVYVDGGASLWGNIWDVFAVD